MENRRRALDTPGEGAGRAWTALLSYLHLVPPPACALPTPCPRLPPGLPTALENSRFPTNPPPRRPRLASSIHSYRNHPNNSVSIGVCPGLHTAADPLWVYGFQDANPAPFRASEKQGFFTVFAYSLQDIKHSPSIAALGMVSLLCLCPPVATLVAEGRFGPLDHPVAPGLGGKSRAPKAAKPPLTFRPPGATSILRQTKR